MKRRPWITYLVDRAGQRERGTISDEIAGSVKALMDPVHELLNGPDGEYLSGEGRPETVRLMVEMPKGLMLPAA